MRFSWKRPLLAILPVLSIGVVGCGGFHTSQSVSPATFLLPRLIHSTPQFTPAERFDVVREPASQFASIK
jgi:hypothetical protein